MGVVTNCYFEAMRIPILRGRAFDGTDTSQSPLVAIVSGAAAARMWPGQDPLGKRLHMSLSADQEWHTVVGVAGSARYREIESPRFDLYVPLRQTESDEHHVVVRTAVNPLKVARRSPRDRVVRFGLSADAHHDDAIVRGTRGSGDHSWVECGAWRWRGRGSDCSRWCLGRGTRRARGSGRALAARGDVVRLMLWQGAKPSLIGMAAGLAIALAVTRVMSQFLFDITPTDPITFVRVAVLFAAVIVLASYLPARRAAAIDPQVVLKEG